MSLNLEFKLVCNDKEPFEIWTKNKKSYDAYKVEIFYFKKPSSKRKVGSFIQKINYPFNFKKINKLIKTYLSKRYYFKQNEKEVKWYLKDEKGNLLQNGFFNAKRK